MSMVDLPQTIFEDPPSDTSFAVATLAAVASTEAMRNNIACSISIGSNPGESRLLTSRVGGNGQELSLMKNAFTSTRDLAQARGWACKIGVTLWMIGIAAAVAAGLLAAGGAAAGTATAASIASYLGVEVSVVT